MNNDYDFPNTINGVPFFHYLELLGFLIYVIDADGYIKYTSGDDVLLGTPPKEECIGKLLSDIFDVELGDSTLLMALKTGQSYSTVSHCRAKNGKMIWWLSDTRPIVRNGIIDGVIAITRPYANIKGLANNFEMIEKNKNIVGKIVAKDTQYIFDDLVFTSEKMALAIDQAKIISSSYSPILIYGETGTGKEMFAQSIHNASLEANKPFVAINCGAIPSSLIESILFGTLKGAYTGAGERMGLFEEAKDGTLFLDEINSMPQDMQVKLLRVLQNKSVRRLGGTKNIDVNPRIIAAVNEDPITCIQQGILRSDLFYRLAVVMVEIPPLRNRLEDIAPLVQHFIMKYNNRLFKNFTNIDQQVSDLFHGYKWPGNVRELQHIIEHAANIAHHNEMLIKIQHLPPYFLKQVEVQPTSFLQNMDFIDYKKDRKYALHAAEEIFAKEYIGKLLQRHNYNITQTAQAMNITRRHLHNVINEFKIQVKDCHD